MEIRWQDSLESALEQARQEKKPLVVDFWSPGCKGCAAFDAGTYQDVNVQRELNEHFIPLKFNTNNPAPGLRELVRTVKALWTPTLVFLDSSKCELGRLVGYVPAEEFLGQLRLALAKHDLLHAQPGRAYERLSQVASENKRLAPEALYWAGVAAFYRDSKTVGSLTPLWEQIGKEHAGDPWWDRANVL